MKTLKVPTQVAGLTAAAQPAGGGAHSLALRTDGTLRSWGANASGQLGDSSTTTRTAPVTPTGLTGVAAGTLATYAYNGDGLRSSKTVLGTTTAFTWDAGGGIPNLLLDGTTAYLYGPDGLPFEQVSVASVATYLHHDQLGSTRLVTDTAGNATASFAYDPYGTVMASTGVTTPTLGYAGQYSDAETGFQYLRARYYEGTTGQFLSRDPVEWFTRSAYGYVAGNPLNAVDPSGLISFGGIVRGVVKVAEVTAVGGALLAVGLSSAPVLGAVVLGAAAIVTVSDVARTLGTCGVDWRTADCRDAGVESAFDVAGFGAASRGAKVFVALFNSARLAMHSQQWGARRAGHESWAWC